MLDKTLYKIYTVELFRTNDLLPSNECIQHIAKHTCQSFQKAQYVSLNKFKMHSNVQAWCKPKMAQPFAELANEKHHQHIL